MKYIRLTKEQFEELQEEFINFLATQQITAAEWKELKETKPHLAEQELDIFSDLIWEGVLQRAEYLQNISQRQLFLFHLGATEMQLIMVKATDTSVDLTTKKGFAWLQQHLKGDRVELYTASKAYSEEKNKDIFELITQGAEITDGTLYNAFKELI